jgi:hypothetical protein
MTQPASFANYGTTISCTFDLAPVGILISGLQVLSEALIRRLLTPRGRLLDDPDYGYELLGEVNDDIDNATIATIGSNMDLEFVKDERVTSSRSTCFYMPLNGSLPIGSIPNIPPGTAPGTLVTSSVINPGVGPFTMVLSASQVTQQLLLVSVQPS